MIISPNTATVSERTGAIYKAIVDGVTTARAIADSLGLTRAQATNALINMRANGYVIPQRRDQRTGHVVAYAINPERKMPRVRTPLAALDALRQSAYLTPLQNAYAWPRVPSTHFATDSLGRLVLGRRRYALTPAEDAARLALLQGVAND
jgi:hypothetical protein